MSAGQKTVRLVHLTCVHPWNDVRIFSKMAVSCAASGYDTHLVALDPATSQSRVFVEFGVNVHLLAGSDIDNRLRRATTGARRTVSYAKALNPKILHFHDPELAPWVATTRMRGTAKIYDVHENLPDQIQTKDNIAPALRSIIGQSVEVVERGLGHAFTGIVTATPRIAERFPKSRTVVVRNLPILGELSATTNSQSSGRVVYIGGITEPRGIVQLVEAVSMVDEVDCLDLAGRVSPDGLLDLLKTLPGWQKVRYHGNLSDRRAVADLLSGAAIGAATLQPFQSFLDSYPIKMFEYLSVGLPVVASDFPLWRELFDGAGGVEFVDPTSPVSIAAGIRAILAVSKEEALARSDKAKRFIQTSANWATEERRLLQAYRTWTRDRVCPD